MKSLIIKNLVSHKMRNKLTAIIFSLTLGTVIFISIWLQENIILRPYFAHFYGATVIVNSGSELIKPWLVNPVLNKHLDKIDDWFYQTPLLSDVVTDMSTIYTHSAHLFGWSPAKFISDGVEIDQ